VRREHSIRSIHMTRTVWGLHMAEIDADAPIKGGFIGIGWAEMGDLSRLSDSREAFKTRFTGRGLQARFDCCYQPLPDELNVLLWFLDGAERRRRIQATLNARQRVKLDLPADVHWMPADQVPEARADWRGHERHFESLRRAIAFVMQELTIADRANVTITTEDGNLTIEQIEKFQ
jgi:hypothetical protein